jgi:histone H3/H4
VPRTPQDQVEEEDDFEDIEPDAGIGAEMDYESDGEEAEAGGFDIDDAPLREASLPLQDDDVDAQAKTTTKKAHKRLPKERKVSRFGIEYPSFQPAVVKRLASTFSKSYGGSGKLNKDTLGALQQATDWFFEQISEDLASYADHAGRKTIEEADVVTLMKRYVDLLLILCSYL